MGRLGALAVLSAIFSFSFAQGTPSCGNGVKCPESAPCCSAYGECGVGAFCLGGCDPKNSHTLKACTPKSVCKSGDYVLDSLSDVQRNTIYLGDGSKINWVSEGTPVVYQGNSILLTMAQDTVGTLLSSSHYVWYGRISVKMKSSRGAGVVTAFVMMSDVKDELDFEFVGDNVEEVQSNYYWQGVLDYDNGKPLTTSSTDQVFHTYTYDWKPDSITWSVDGTVLRTLYRDDTFNSTTGGYDFPQTPSRIQLSLWPAGLPSNDKGTINWAGGLINWNSPYMSNGYYSAQIESVDVECYDPPPNAIIQGSTSYVYTNPIAFNNSVAITDDSTILGSFFATGENPGFNPDKKKKGDGSPTDSDAPVETNDVQTVPGVTGTGARGEDDQNGDVHGGQDPGGFGSSSGGSSGGVTYVGGGNGQFVQNYQPYDGGAVAGRKEQAFSGSAFAILMAFLALVVL